MEQRTRREVPHGGPIMLESGLRAGFLITSHRRQQKEFHAFELPEGDERPTVSRPCTDQEQKKLNRLVFGDQAVHSIDFQTTDGQDCLLFYNRA